MANLPTYDARAGRFLSPEEIDKLQSGGYVSPEFAEDWKSKAKELAMMSSPLALYAAGNKLVDQNRAADFAEQKAKLDATQAAAPQSMPAQSPMPPMATPVAVPRVGDFGLGALQRGLGAQQERTDKAMDGAQDRLAKSFLKRKQAAQDLAELEAQKAAELASQSRVHTRALEAADAARQEREMGRQKHLEGVANELRTVQQEARDFKIDPDRRSTGQKALGAIGAFLGGFGAGLLGSSHNQVLTVIQEQIANDINAQREELANKRAAVGDKANELGVMRQRFGDERAGEEAFRVRELERYKKQIEDLAGEYMAPEAQARLQELMAGIDAEQSDSELRVIAEKNNRFMQSTQAQAGIAGTRANLAMQNAEMAAKALPPGAIMLPGGYAGAVTDKEMAKKAREQAGASEAVRRLAKDIKQSVSAVGTQVFPTDVAEKIKTKGMMLQTALRASGGMGSLDKGTQEFLDAMVGGDLTGLRTDKVLFKLDGLLEADQIQTDAKMEAYGFPRVQETASEKNSKYGAERVQ